MSLREDKDSKSPEPESFQTAGGSSGPSEAQRARSGKFYFSQPRSRMELEAVQAPCKRGQNLAWRGAGSPPAPGQASAGPQNTDGHRCRWASWQTGPGQPVPQSPECRLPYPDGSCGRWSGSSVGMIPGTQTATAGRLGYNTLEEVSWKLVGALWVWAQTFLLDYLLPFSSIKRVFPPHIS